MSTYARDLTNGLVSGVSLPPAARTSNTNGTAVDLAAGEGLCTATIVSGTITDGTHLVAIQESDTSGGTYSDITPVQTVTNTANNTVQRVSFLRTKRYVRAKVTVSGSPNTGGVYGVVIDQQQKSVPY